MKVALVIVIALALAAIIVSADQRQLLPYGYWSVGEVTWESGEDTIQDSVLCPAGYQIALLKLTHFVPAANETMRVIFACSCDSMLGSSVEHVMRDSIELKPAKAFREYEYLMDCDKLYFRSVTATGLWRYEAYAVRAGAASDHGCTGETWP